MELADAIRGRRSVRKYTGTSVGKEVLERIIEAGQWAPTACNVQGFHFIVIDQPDVMARIIKGGGAAFLKNTRQAILVLYDNQTDNLEYHDNIQSAAAGIQNMLLTAHDLHVGTCWINHLPRIKYLRTLLSIPSWYDPIALVALGYFDQQPREVPRKRTIGEIVSYNTYAGTLTRAPKNPVLLTLRRLARKAYLYVSVFPPLQKIARKFEKKFDN